MLVNDNVDGFNKEQTTLYKNVLVCTVIWVD